MTTQLSPNELRRVIEARHGCRAGLANSEFVKLIFAGSTLWEGLVHVFDLAGHPKANQAYAWSSPVPGSDQWRPISMLHLPPVTSAVEAVRAATTMESETV
jgi:hypothetical protein